MLKLFYERKQKGHLDDYTLAEAVELARELVAVTIRLAPPDAGVGGPIDVLTLTKDGVHWVQRKERNAPFPTLSGPRLFVSMLGGEKQPLDGLLCVRCELDIRAFSYAGDQDVELLEPTIKGPCKLAILPGAHEKMPAVVNRLERMIGATCEIIDPAPVPPFKPVRSP